MQFSVYFLIVIIFIGVFEVESNGVKKCVFELNYNFTHVVESSYKCEIDIKDNVKQKVYKYQNYMYYLQNKPNTHGLDKASYFHRYFYYLGDKVNYENVHNPVKFCSLYINNFQNFNYPRSVEISERSVEISEMMYTRLSNFLLFYGLISRDENIDYYKILDDYNTTDFVLEKRVECVYTIFDKLKINKYFNEKDIFEYFYYRRHNNFYDYKELKNKGVQEKYVADVQYKIRLVDDTKDIYDWCKEEDFKEKTGLNDIKYKVTKEANEEDTSQRGSFFYDFMGINSTNDINASSSSFVINDSSEYENFNED